MTPTLMEELKDSTRALHDGAEGHQFQHLLVQGKLSQPAYKLYLEQLLCVHERLEELLDKCVREDARLSSVINQQQYQVAFIKQDLCHFQMVAAETTILSSTKKFLQELDAAYLKYPLSLLGYHYVLLGSKHGGKMVARNLQFSYDLQDGSGAIYFDPYGGLFMDIWLGFKNGMNTLSLSPAERDAICQAAKDMFVAVTAIGAEVLAKQPDSSATKI